MNYRPYKFSTTRNRGFRRPKAEVISSVTLEDASCITTQQSSSDLAQVSAVSRAISGPVPLSNSREKLTIETKDTIRKCSNQSRGEPEKTARPNCYQCKYRGVIPGNAHSKCVHPKIAAATNDPFMSMLSTMGSRGFRALGVNIGDELGDLLGVTGIEHGIKSGWFNWPLNFDPAWLLTCDGFEQGN